MSDDARSRRDCIHCGNPFRPQRKEDKFCCSGCEHVYHLIRSEDLGQFYELQAGAKTRPVETLAFEQRDYSWVEPLVETAEVDGQTAELELSVSGVSCAACVWLIQRVFERETGAVSAIVDATRGSVRLRWQSGGCDLAAFAKTLQGFGYELGPPGAAGTSGDAAMVKRVGLCAAFAMNAMAFTLPRYLGMPPDFVLAGLFELIAATSAALAMAVGGSYFIARATRALKSGVVHIDLPIALGVTAAFAGSIIGWIAGFAPLLYFDFVAIFIFLMLGGRWLQEATLARSRSRLVDRGGTPTHYRPADGTPAQAISTLSEGERYLLSPGEIVPVASRVAREAPFGLGWISGEAEAPSIPAGGIAPSGSVYLGDSETELRAREAWSGSLLERLTNTNRGEQGGDPVLARVISIYVLVIIMLGIGGAAAWLSASGDWSRSLQVAVSVFVVSCPCALGVALPLAERIAAARATTFGAYPQRPGFWTRVARARKVVFDKTGTLTLGRPELVNADALEDLGADERRALSRLTETSVHPLSRTLAEQLAARGVEPAEFAAMDVAESPGIGLRIGDESSPSWSLQRDGQALADAVFLRDGQRIATFHFRDVLREGAADEVADLREAGLDVYLMSGDRAEKVAETAGRLGLPESHWRARMSPDDKADWVADLNARDTLYVGDGANDSLAFDNADCTATPATELGLLQDKADLYFLGRRMDWLGQVRGIARRRRAAIRATVGFSVAYNIGAATAALAGVMSPLVAAIIMPLSSSVTIAIVSMALSKKRSTAIASEGPRRSREISNFGLNPPPASPL